MKKTTKIINSIIAFILFSSHANAQNTDKDAMRYALNPEGSYYIQATLLNQVWMRFNQDDPGTLVQGKQSSNQLDIGLRRTRMQLFGQITDKVFVYFQFGQNNFNAQSNFSNNRKVAAFFHDAVCEYKVSKNNALKLGGGLTIANGLSRFTQPSIGTIMTMDVPVFAQATVDQTDQFSRKLSVYARGQIGHVDYRFSLSDPFPVTTNGTTAPAISKHATFAQIGRNKQLQGYVMWQFFEHETHTTPYMTGTYLGKKKILNVAGGMIWQKNAMWLKNGSDTQYQDMKLFCAEAFLDMPLNKEKATAVSAYTGFFHTDYGTNYLRFNGIMNPASGTELGGLAKDAGNQYGNAYPMFGTGNVLYSQLGMLLPKELLKNNGQLLPYVSATIARYRRLGDAACNTYNAGVSWLIYGHKAKLSIDYQNRPAFLVFDDGSYAAKGHKNAVTLQYQIFF